MRKKDIVTQPEAEKKKKKKRENGNSFVCHGGCRLDDSLNIFFK